MDFILFYNYLFIVHVYFLLLGTDRCIKDTIEVHECNKLENQNMWSIRNKRWLTTLQLTLT